MELKVDNCTTFPNKNFILICGSFCFKIEIEMKYSRSIKEKVRELRATGLGLNQISDLSQVPKSTIRLWIKDIKLSSKQKNALNKRVFDALQKGRIKAQKLNSQRRIEKEGILLSKGRTEIGDLSKKELLIAGVALYWAEGFKNKHEKRLGFCNSDPQMILFYLKWLKNALGISGRNITARVSLNIAYKSKEPKIKKYWANVTGIPLSQFTSSFYQNSQWKKQYSDDNYHGVLRIHVKESLNHLLKMRGWIEGIKLNA